jgi:apolipoprotein N-acyltransferase
LRQWQKEHRTWMLVGLPWYDNGRYYNAIALYDPESRLKGLYYKVRPIPVAEGWATSGESFAPLMVAGIPLGMGLCSELIDTAPAQAMTAGGAQALIFLSSLDHLPGKTAMALHTAFAPFRAAESGRHIALSGSTGATLMVSPDGVIGPMLFTRNAGRLVALLPTATGTTPYMAGGRYLPVILLLLTAAAFFSGRMRLKAPWSRSESGYSGQED